MAIPFGDFHCTDSYHADYAHNNDRYYNDHECSVVLALVDRIRLGVRSWGEKVGQILGKVASFSKFY